MKPRRSPRRIYRIEHTASNRSPSTGIDFGKAYSVGSLRGYMPSPLARLVLFKGRGGVRGGPRGAPLHEPAPPNGAAFSEPTHRDPRGGPGGRARPPLRPLGAGFGA
eukprot:7366617-Pyramimonas_sp.AAC.1